MSRAIAGSEVAITVEFHIFHEQRHSNDQRCGAAVLVQGLCGGLSGFCVYLLSMRSVADPACSRCKALGWLLERGCERRCVSKVGCGAVFVGEALAHKPAGEKRARRVRVKSNGAIDIGERLGIAPRDNAPRRDCNTRARNRAKRDGLRIVGDGPFKVERARLVLPRSI